VIVYGDPCELERPSALRERLRRRVAALGSGDPPLNTLRTLLIEAGRLEQAVLDALPEEAGLCADVQSVTDFAAAAFYARWGAAAGTAPSAAADGPPPRQRLLAALDRLDALPDAELPVKLPEGFACYALFPEQYCAAAGRWLDAHPADDGRVTVVGVRSIGTTLSALVAETLRAAGRNVQRLSVRPTGHPHDRSVEIDSVSVEGSAWALVVDEGPGLSGSSMAATAEALFRAGLSRDRIAFLPGHGGEPGPQAPDLSRRWWAIAPRLVVSSAELRWDGRSLTETLAARTEALLSGHGRVERVEVLGGGLWRRVAYADSEAWPAVCAPFERSKYRCVLESGAAVLWKFSGLSGEAAERDFERLAARAGAGWTPRPLGASLGFVATEWVEGAPLTQADAGPELLAHIGRYFRAVAGPPLSPTEEHAALARLVETLYWNTWEACGEEAAEETRAWSDAIRAHPRQEQPSAGDGRPSPHEWLRLPSGKLLKTDSTGYDVDHTVVGKQPLAWDVAGTLVEWNLPPAAAAPLLKEALHIPLPDAVLSFYKIAYAAFRLGQCSLCAGMGGDPDEIERLRRAAGFYSAVLQTLLAVDAGEERTGVGG